MIQPVSIELTIVFSVLWIFILGCFGTVLLRIIEVSGVAMPQPTNYIDSVVLRLFFGVLIVPPIFVTYTLISIPINIITVWIPAALAVCTTILMQRARLK
ncbi:MAG: hypothetical protein GF309_08640, partial [Candidatus Lokiarchaeota archaeon]|nr:hypothetical protein [Candidatus Lokiarchaeota archaeon]